MGDIKLEVGEDYIDEMFYNIHIESYESESGHYISRGQSRYLNDGTRIFWNSVLKKYESSGINIIKHVIKNNKQISSDYIYNAFYDYSKTTDIDNSREFELGLQYWKAAIEWYKEQTK